MVLNENFRRKLGEAMKLRGLTQTGLAKILKKTPQYVHGYLKGQDVGPTLSVVENFANALGIPAYALLDERPIEEHLGVHA